jgi:tellurite resistance protein
MFGIDIKLKKGTQYLLITLVITLIFLGLEEAFQGILPYSIFVSALLAFLLLLPVHYGVTRLVQKLFPHVTETETYLERRKHELFGAALRSAMRDGKVDEKEQAMLLSLVKELQLKPHEYEKLLKEARTHQTLRDTYTILRYDFFAPELRAKSGARYLITILILTLIFVVLSEAIEGILPFPAFISVVCAFACIVPVNRGVMKITDRLFPAAKESEKVFDTRRLDIYRAALAGAYADKKITEREQASLVALIKDLNITPAEHERVLLEIKRGDDPR